MPIDYIFDADRRLLVARAHGVLDEADAARHEREVGSNPVFRDFNRLIDLSGVIDVLDTLTETGRVRQAAGRAAAWDRAGGPAKMVIVAPNDFLYALGRMYLTYRGLYARGRCQAAVVRSMAEALEFLGLEEGAIGESLPDAAAEGAG